MEVYSPEEIREAIRPENFIGEGRYREVYKLGESAVVKVIKERFTKRYGPLKIDIKTRPYLFMRFGIRDYNQHELINYKKVISAVPEELKRCFAPILQVSEMDGMQISISELVTNFDGSLSKTMEDNQTSNPYFWDTLFNLREAMVKKRLFYLDFRPKNVLVRDMKDNVQVPVIIDHKRVGEQNFPLQFWLRNPESLEDKFNRRFVREMLPHVPRGDC